VAVNSRNVDIPNVNVFYTNMSDDYELEEFDGYADYEKSSEVEDLCDENGVLLDRPINKAASVKQIKAETKQTENEPTDNYDNYDDYDDWESVQLGDKLSPKKLKFVPNKNPPKKASSKKTKASKTKLSDEPNYDGESLSHYQTRRHSQAPTIQSSTQKRQSKQQNKKSIEDEKNELVKKIFDLQFENNNMKSIIHQQQSQLQEQLLDLKSMKSIIRSQEKQLTEVARSQNYEDHDKHMSDDQMGKSLLAKVRSLSDQLTLGSCKNVSLITENEKLRKELSHYRKADRNHAAMTSLADYNSIQSSQKDQGNVVDLNVKIVELENLVKSLQLSLRTQRKGFVAEITSLRYTIQQNEKKHKIAQIDSEDS
jgi:hypothetical protein